MQSVSHCKAVRSLQVGQRIFRSIERHEITRLHQFHATGIDAGGFRTEGFARPQQMERSGIKVPCFHVDAETAVVRIERGDRGAVLYAKGDRLAP